MISQLLLSNVFMPLVELCSSSKCWSIYKNMKRFQQADSKEQQQWQHQRIAELLKLATQKVPFWQKALARLQLNSNDISAKTALSILSQLPITTKQDYSAGFPDQITVNESQDNWQYLSSAGTTDRMTVVTDFVKRDHLRAAEYLNLDFAINQAVGERGIDIPPHACNVVCGLADAGPEPLFAFLWWSFKNKQLFTQETLSDVRGRVERQIIMKRKTLLPIDVGTWSDMEPQLDQYLDQILKEKIKVIRGLPHFLFWLAKRAKQRQLTFLHVEAVLPYGGLACEEMVKTITNTFSAEFIDAYGTGEVGAIGCVQRNENAIEIYQQLVYVEVLDDNNQPVSVGGMGRIVVTDLNNFAMPIIRYEIGDIGKVLTADSTTQQPSKISVIGRKQEMFVNGRGERIPARQLHNVFYRHENLINFKVEQISVSLYKVVIVTNGEVDKLELANELTELFALSKKPMIKESPFILPESSGKYLAFKKKKDLSYA